MPQIVNVKKLQDMGFNLMPLQKESKFPIAGVSWDHLKSHKYTGDFPDSCNVAVICGEVSGGLFVVDCDHKSLYDEFKEYHGKTRIVESGKGHHFYFRSIGFCPPSKKFNDKRLRHIDVKSEGGYVVSEDSIHPDTKKPYILICDVEPMRVDPKLIRDKLEKLGFDVGGKSFEEIEKGLSEGGRDDGTFSYACHCIRDLGLFGEGLRLKVDELNTRHSPPLPSSDIERIIKSSLKYEGKNIAKRLKDISDFRKKEEKDNKEPINIKMQDITPIYEQVPIEFDAMIIAVGERMTYTKESEFICQGCQEEGKTPRTVHCDDYHKIYAPFCFKHKKQFIMDVQTMQTGYIQMLRIQEFLEDSRNSTPIQFDAEILDENVGEAFTSDRKTFVAKFRSIPQKNGYNDIVFEILKMTDLEQKEGCLPKSEEIAEWKAHPDIFSRVRDSIAPDIMINPTIIESLMLWGAGGHALNGKRSSIHMAMLGDAQLGKSDLLKKMHNILSGSGFTVGRNTSGAGLTIGMVKMYNGTSVAQAGLLPQHTGHEVIIDEGDKMEPKDQNSILDCMEDETSSLTKNGAIGLTLPAKCPILFAGNPKGGKYIESKNRSVLDNFNMETPFISRFDIIWLMVDSNSPELDKLITEHIRSFRDRKDTYMKLDELQRYFNYIKTLTPTISKEIEVKIEELYTKMRPLNKLNSLPVGIRQFHGIYRLCTACASAHLRNEVTIQDFNIVENIIRDALKSMKMDLESGEIHGSVLPSRVTKESIWNTTWFDMEDVTKMVWKNEFIAKLGTKEPYYSPIKAREEFDKRERAGLVELDNDSGMYKMVT